MALGTRTNIGLARLTWVLFLVAAWISQPMIVRAQRWDIGARGGIAISGLYGTDADSVGTDRRTGIKTAFRVSRWISKNAAIQSGIDFIVRGGREKTLGTTVTARIDYLAIPVTGIFSRPLSDRLRATIAAGPVFAFKTAARVNGLASPALDKITSGFDFLGMIGTGVQWAMSPAWNVSTGVEYEVGFISIHHGHNSLDFRNYTFSILVGIERKIGYW